MEKSAGHLSPALLWAVDVVMSLRTREMAIEDGKAGQLSWPHWSARQLAKWDTLDIEDEVETFLKVHPPVERAPGPMYSA